MNWADLYSGRSAATGVAVVSGPVGPNQSVVTASGQSGAVVSNGRGSAFSWLGLVLALVILRILVQMGGRLS